MRLDRCKGWSGLAGCALMVGNRSTVNQEM